MEEILKLNEEISTLRKLLIFLDCKQRSEGLTKHDREYYNATSSSYERISSQYIMKLNEEISTLKNILISLDQKRNLEGLDKKEEKCYTEKRENLVNLYKNNKCTAKVLVPNSSIKKVS